MARLIFALLAMMCGLKVAAAELVKLHDFEVAGWTAAAYGDTATDKLDNCMATGFYRNNVEFHVIVFRDYRWGLGFSSQNWRLPGDALRLAYRFDEGQWFTTDVSVHNEGSLILWYMANDPTQAHLFRRSRIMDISFSQGEYGFRLDGTARLLVTLAQCVKIALDAENGVAAEKPRAKPKPNNKVVAKTKPAKAPQAAESTPRDSSGTGFIVSQKGHILTNHHVVEKCGTITVSRTGDVAKPAALLRADVTNDLAVLKIDASPAADETARFRARSLRAGESIAIYGFPLAGTLSASGNIVGGNVSSLAGLSDDVRLLQVSAPVQPGNSGGPLLDSQGAVAGIVNGKLNELAAIEVSGSLPQNVNFSIKANVGMNFLDAHSIPYEMSSETAALDLPAIADKAKKFTVFIACRQ
ncbi:MAG TPA: trypsin-like peptidase domain-containing protein [Nordella sp.]|nr:trypsin-like peptidase domain-containing protein [Nordella sp.]